MLINLYKKKVGQIFIYLFIETNTCIEQICIK